MDSVLVALASASSAAPAVLRHLVAGQGLSRDTFDAAIKLDAATISTDYGPRGLTATRLLGAGGIGSALVLDEAAADPSRSSTAAPMHAMRAAHPLAQDGAAVIGGSRHCGVILSATPDSPAAGAHGLRDASASSVCRVSSDAHQAALDGSPTLASAAATCDVMAGANSAPMAAVRLEMTNVQPVGAGSPCEMHEAMGAGSPCEMREAMGTGSPRERREAMGAGSPCDMREAMGHRQPSAADAQSQSNSNGSSGSLRARDGGGTKSPIGTEHGHEVPSLGTRRCHTGGPVRPYLMLADFGSYDQSASGPPFNDEGAAMLNQGRLSKGGETPSFFQCLHSTAAATLFVLSVALLVREQRWQESSLQQRERQQCIDQQRAQQSTEQHQRQQHLERLVRQQADREKQMRFEAQQFNQRLAPSSRGCRAASEDDAVPAAAPAAYTAGQ